MDAARTVAWLLGFFAIVAGSFLAYAKTNMNPWVAVVLLGTGVLVYAGLAVMAYGATSASDATPAPALEDSPFRDQDDASFGRR